ALPNTDHHELVAPPQSFLQNIDGSNKLPIQLRPDRL
ncbi:uncharacterized protein METZ01_LOCUS243078, partial [marine metagenome]